ncbi:MAG: hypothetical protein Q7W45_14840 [Bacteroidota bacterium]|nr:hypothetical protein [Bacteroidota bacterium]MDP3147357.1 hypothetical protein [Bacteroidota bacterium]
MKTTIQKQFLITSIMLALIGICSAQTETKISKDSLPSAVHTELHKKYITYTVNSILKITDKQQNITYKVEVQKKSTMIELLYDNHGKLISKDKSKVYTYDGTEKPRSTPVKSNDGHSGHQH